MDGRGTRAKSQLSIARAMQMLREHSLGGNYVSSHCVFLLHRANLEVQRANKAFWQGVKELGGQGSLIIQVLFNEY